MHIKTPLINEINSQATEHEKNSVIHIPDMRHLSRIYEKYHLTNNKNRNPILPS